MDGEQPLYDTSLCVRCSRLAIQYSYDIVLSMLYREKYSNVTMEDFYVRVTCVSRHSDYVLKFETDLKTYTGDKRYFFVNVHLTKDRYRSVNGYLKQVSIKRATV